MKPFRPEEESRAVLSAVVDASDDPIILGDLEGIICAWNHAAERVFGYSAAEALGQPVSVIFPADRRDEHHALIDRINRGEPIRHYETVRQAKDGRRIDVLITASPVRDASGEIVGALKIVKDLTTQKRADVALHTSELRWRSVIDAAVDGIIVIDAKGRIEAFNRGAERLFGYRALDVIGHNVNVLMPSPYQEEHDAYLSRYLETGVPHIIGKGREVTGLRKDGTTFPLHLSVGEMTIAGERKFTGILHDLTARVRIEEQLREQTSLAHIGEMAAVIAHEVKNPLAGVRGAIQVIGSRLPPESKDALMIREIIARIDALNDLMQDMLLFARPPQPKAAPVDVAALVATTAGLLNSDPSRKDVHVAVEGSAPPVAADADLLKIVFENLLVNGAHAMKGRGTIHVSIEVVDETCRIAFRDAGPGIPADVRDRIFTPFFTTKARGTGLGLPTAKRLVEAHRGTIRIVCPPDGGTTVLVQLPLASIL